MEFADYKDLAVIDLRSYTHLKARAEALSRQINMLAEICRMSCVSSDISNTAAVVSSDVSRLELLEKELKTINFRIVCIESALEALSDVDKELITSFYITRQRNTVNNLARKTYTDRSCIYRRAQKALERYIYACFGVTKI